MSIAIERVGQGPNLVLLHGWGMNSAVWHGITNELATQYCVHLVDLPGFGHSPWQSDGDNSLAGLAVQISQQLPARYHLVGWSLGGLLAAQIALLQPWQVKSLVTVASSPCFVSRPDWVGVSDAVLADFHRQLAADFNQTIERFLAIQTLGSEHARDDIRQLKQLLGTRPAPQPAALSQGLQLLAQSDMRTEFGQLALPWLRIYGRLDALVPSAAIKRIDELYHHSQSMVLAKASHAPFISHPAEFIAPLRAFLATHDGCG